MSIEVAEIKLSKGFQFTLPAAMRQKHHLKPGQKIELIDMDDEIIMRPKRKRSILELVGKYKMGKKFNATKEHDAVVSSWHSK